MLTEIETRQPSRRHRGDLTNFPRVFPGSKSFLPQSRGQGLLITGQGQRQRPFVSQVSAFIEKGDAKEPIG